MSDILERDLVSYDPLTEVTRRERTALLGLSMLGLALVAVPLIPEKFGVFGLEFTKLNQKNFLSIYALLLGYYVAAFSIYAFTDFVAWRRTERIRHSEYVRAHVAAHPEGKNTAQTPIPVFYAWNKRLNPVYYGFASFAIARLASRLRALFEFALPLVFAGYVIIRLLST